MQLDPRTLAFYTSAISLLLAGLAYLYGRSRRVYPGYHWWVGSLLLFGMAIISIALRGLVPGWLASIGPTALGLLSLLAISAGQRRFNEQEQLPRSAPLVALLTLLLMALLHDPQQPLALRSVGASGVGLLAMLVGWQFVGQSQAALATTARWVAVLLIAFGTIRLARGIQFGLADSGFDVLGPQVSSILSYGANAVFVTLWAFGFMMLCAARVEHELDQSRQALRELARKDSLTGLLNRRAFFADARAELERARRYPAPLALLMIDIDDFKSVNDAHGHQAGDQLLLAISQQLQAQSRGSDLLARIGGEEFAALLVQTPPADALQVAERLRSEVQDTTIDAQGTVVARTVSIGIAPGDPAAAALETLMRRADVALYRAKDAGRNQVCVDAD